MKNSFLIIFKTLRAIHCTVLSHTYTKGMNNPHPTNKDSMFYPIAKIVHTQYRDNFTIASAISMISIV
jgi:hypothetical protein